MGFSQSAKLTLQPVMQLLDRPSKILKYDVLFRLKAYEVSVAKIRCKIIILEGDHKLTFLFF